VSKLPALRGSELIRILARYGFRVERTRGSHVRLAHPDGRKTTIPVHPGEDVGRGLIAKILRDCELGPDDLV